MGYLHKDDLIGVGVPVEKADSIVGSTTIDNGRKYIIQFGSDRTTAYCRTNAAIMESQADFDGTVIDTVIPDTYLGLINGINSITRGYKITWNDMQLPLEDLQAANFKRFTHNFIRLNIGSAQATGYPVTNPFKYTDRATYLHNIKMFARLAKESGMKGLLIDSERYNSSSFWGPYSSLDQTYTFAQYQAAFKSLGKEAMSTIQSEFSDAVIVFAVSYEQVEFHSPVPLHANTYALLPAFLDGFHDAALPPTKIINLGEEAFSNQTGPDYDYDIRYQNRANLTVCHSKNYDAVHEHGLATFLDYPGSGFDFADNTVNYNTAAQFRANLGMMLARVPRFIFVYSQQTKWFSGTWGTDATPKVYIDALASAREDYGIEVVYDAKNLPGCKLYLDAYDLTVANAASISSWTNRVTGTADATQTGGNRPTMETSSLFGTGVPGVKFTVGSSQYFLCNSIASNMTGTDLAYWMIVVQIGLLNDIATDVTYLGFGKAGGANTDISWGLTASERWYARKTDDSGSATQLSGINQTSVEGPLNTEAHVFSFRSDGTTGQGWIDNTENIVKATQDKGLITCDQCFIGAAAKSSALLFHSGQMGAVVYGTGWIDQDDLFVAARKLANRFQITTCK